MLTLSNRETFVVLAWLEENPKRRARVRAQAARLAAERNASPIARLSDFLLKELQSELPRLKGIAAEFMRSSIGRVNFHELAIALLAEAGMQSLPVVSGEW